MHEDIIMEDYSLSYLGCCSATLIEHRSKDTGVIASIATLPAGKLTFFLNN